MSSSRAAAVLLACLALCAGAPCSRNTTIILNEGFREPGDILYFNQTLQMPATPGKFSFAGGSYYYASWASITHIKSYEKGMGRNTKAWVSKGGVKDLYATIVFSGAYERGIDAVLLIYGLNITDITTTTARIITTNPTSTDFTFTDPTSTDFTITDPTSTDFTITDPTSTDPTSTYYTTTDLTSTDFTTTDPTSTDFTTTDPTSTDLSTTDLTTTDPTTTDLTTTGPTTTDLTTTDPTTTDPTNADSTTTDPITSTITTTFSTTTYLTTIDPTNTTSTPTITNPITTAQFDNQL